MDVEAQIRHLPKFVWQIGEMFKMQIQDCDSKAFMNLGLSSPYIRNDNIGFQTVIKWDYTCEVTTSD